MKTVTIFIEREEGQSEREHEIQCAVTVNGQYYHDCLLEVFNLLVTYDEGQKLTPSARRVLEDLRNDSAAHFMGVFHGE